LKFIEALINSNIYIALAAVLFTVQAQIQLGMKPQWHPYLFIIFFATLFEYNVHRLITVLTNNAALNSKKHRWVRENLNAFYGVVAVSVAGFIFVTFMAKKEVLIALAPVAVLTVFYSIPFFGFNQTLFRLREIPYLKIFLISFVWSYSTIILPIIQANITLERNQLILMLVERFLFIFAITIPFDVRDMEADQQAGLKTIPLSVKENRVWTISYLALLLFFVLSVIHYYAIHYRFICFALSISALTTYVFLRTKKIRSWPYYHYGVLDGTILFQGLMVLLFYYFMAGNWR